MDAGGAREGARVGPPIVKAVVGRPVAERASQPNAGSA